MLRLDPLAQFTLFTSLFPCSRVIARCACLFYFAIKVSFSRTNFFTTPCRRKMTRYGGVAFSLFPPLREAGSSSFSACIASGSRLASQGGVFLLPCPLSFPELVSLCSPWLTSADSFSYLPGPFFPFLVWFLFFPPHQVSGLATRRFPKQLLSVFVPYKAGRSLLFFSPPSSRGSYTLFPALFLSSVFFFSLYDVPELSDGSSSWSSLRPPPVFSVGIPLPEGMMVPRPFLPGWTHRCVHQIPLLTFSLELPSL